MAKANIEMMEAFGEFIKIWTSQKKDSSCVEKGSDADLSQFDGFKDTSLSSKSSDLDHDQSFSTEYLPEEYLSTDRKSKARRKFRVSNTQTIIYIYSLFSIALNIMLPCIFYN